VLCSKSIFEESAEKHSSLFVQSIDGKETSFEQQGEKLPYETRLG
jgi:hypothetical protein